MSKSVKNQRDRVLQSLKEQSMTTIDFREIGIMHPSGRIKELKQAGWNIVTRLENVIDSCGIEHENTARYALILG